jgi:DNA-binding GntR family transcriptional regulator
MLVLIKEGLIILNKNKNFNEQVYEIIKNSIIEDKFKPGEKLSVERISKQLGVSRTPVSNALQSLERDGYVEIVSQSGTYVKELSLEEIKSIYELREEIEGLVVRTAFVKSDKVQLEFFLKKFNQFLERNEDRKLLLEYFQLDLEFHEYLVGLCPPIIRKETRNIIELTKRSRRLNLLHELEEKGFKDIMEKEIENHSNIVIALLGNDVEKAVFFAKHDVRETKEQVLQYLYAVKKEVDTEQ